MVAVFPVREGCCRLRVVTISVTPLSLSFFLRCCADGDGLRAAAAAVAATAAGSRSWSSSSVGMAAVAFVSPPSPSVLHSLFCPLPVLSFSVPLRGQSQSAIICVCLVLICVCVVQKVVILVCVCLVIVLLVSVFIWMASSGPLDGADLMQNIWSDYRGSSCRVSSMCCFMFIIFLYCRGGLADLISFVRRVSLFK